MTSEYRQPLSERTASQRNIASSRSADVYSTKSPLSRTSPPRALQGRTSPIRDRLAQARNHPDLLRNENDLSPSRAYKTPAIYLEPAEDFDHEVGARLPLPSPLWPELPPIEIIAEELRKSEDSGSHYGSTPRLSAAPSARFSYSIFPSDANTKAPRLSLASTIGRVRSLSAGSTASYGLFPHLPLEPDPSTIPAVPPIPPMEELLPARPRSISTPVIPAEKLAAEATSAEDDSDSDLTASSPDAPESSADARPKATTTARAAYPAPRRLQRKRADSKLAQSTTAARAPPSTRSSSASITQRFANTRPAIMSSWSGYNGRQGAISPVVEEHHSRSSHSSRSKLASQSRPSTGASSGWRTQNRGPNPHEYQPPPPRSPTHMYPPQGQPVQRDNFNPMPQQMLRGPQGEPPMIAEEAPQLPPFFKTADSDTRPSTSGSQKSGRLSLYKWLNDSYTSWAKIYYGSGGAMHLGVPPNVTEIAEDGSVKLVPNRQADARLTQSSTTASNTPTTGSFGAQSIPPTPSVPAMYMHAQDLPLVGLGYNSPRGTLTPMMHETNSPGNRVPSSLRAARGPPHQGQLGQGFGQRSATSGRRSPPGQYHNQQEYYGPSPSGPHGYPPARQHGPGPRFYGAPAQPQGHMSPPHGPPQRAQRSPPSRQYSGESGPYGTPPSQRRPNDQRKPSHPYGSPISRSPPTSANWRREAPSSPAYEPEDSPQRRIAEEDLVLDYRGHLEEVNEVDEEEPAPVKHIVTPERNPERLTTKSESPGSAGFPEQVYIPRVRPRQDEGDVSPVSPDSAYGDDGYSPEPRTVKQMPSHLMNNAPSPTDLRTSYMDLDPESPDLAPTPDARPPQALGWPSPSYDSSKAMFDPGNRQIVLFCIGFVLPLAWILAAVLPLPSRPEMRQIGSDGFYSETRPAAANDLFDTADVARYQKARRWRVTNRIMGVLGVCILVVIGACAGVATRN